MIHDVTIPFSFDTTPIEEQYSYGYYTKEETDEVDWRKYVSNYMDVWMRDHAEEVVDEAALLLVAKASRKKAWREVLAEVKAEGGAE